MYDLDNKPQLVSVAQILKTMTSHFNTAQHFESPGKKYLRNLIAINDRIYELSAALQADPDKHRPSDLRYDLVKVIEGLEAMQTDIELVLNGLEGE